jgi:hypothetical protein
MAHLMPEKSKPTEASLRAAQLRAEKKAKARRTKIIVGIVMLAIAAVVGPPAFRWLADAVNEAGSTKTDEEPATTSVPDASTTDTTTDATTDTGAPTSSAPTASTPGGGHRRSPGRCSGRRRRDQRRRHRRHHRHRCDDRRSLISRALISGSASRARRGRRPAR